ncbi:MAG TPA: hypothetical protein VN721_06655 [Flavipsychrobacter sp.]|nr:hypothetical protein [Flavipsychrobacter sp.]
MTNQQKIELIGERIQDLVKVTMKNGVISHGHFKQKTDYKELIDIGYYLFQPESFRYPMEKILPIELKISNMEYLDYF